MKKKNKSHYLRIISWLLSAVLLWGSLIGSTATDVYAATVVQGKYSYTVTRDSKDKEKLIWRVQVNQERNILTHGSIGFFDPVGLTITDVCVYHKGQEISNIKKTEKNITGTEADYDYGNVSGTTINDIVEIVLTTKLDTKNIPDDGNISVQCGIMQVTSTGAVYMVNQLLTINSKSIPSANDPIKPEDTDIKVNTKFSINNITYKVSSITGNRGNVWIVGPMNKTKVKAVIPATVKYKGKTFTVTAIGKRAFYGCKKLKAITIADSVTTIGAEAFKGCTSLGKVTVGKKAKLKSIGKQAFYGDKALKKVYLKGKYLKTVGSKAFAKGNAKPTFYLLKSKQTVYKKLLKGKVPAKTIYKSV